MIFRPSSSVPPAAPASARRVRATALLCFTALGLANCATGPDYQGPPKIDLGQRLESPQAAPGDALALERWWERLGDPDLARLVDQALAHNLDLRQAVLRIEEARAALATAGARQYPTLDAMADVIHQRQSLNGPTPLFGDRDKTIHDLGAGASWEPDLFGRIRRGVDSATAQSEAAKADADGVRLSVMAEVARVYFTLREAQQELAARKASIAALGQAVELTRQRVTAGDLPAFELDSAELRLQSAMAGLPSLQARIRTSAIALGTLAGGLPEQELGLESTAPALIPWPELPVGQRVDLLGRRPDIRAAERRLAASTADVGLASAERFPKLTISASGGFQALAPGNLLKQTSQEFSLVPLISWRILDGGQVRAQIRASEAREAEAAVAYEKAVRAALSDVEQSLENYRRSRQALESQQAVTRRATTVLDMALRRYARGDITRLELLDAERQKSDSQEAEARAAASVATGLALAMKALGGGWEAAPATVVGDGGNTARGITAPRRASAAHAPGAGPS